MTRIVIVGTGLIGASVGLALKRLEPGREIAGWDANAGELAKALEVGAIDRALGSAKEVLAPGLGEIYVLAAPVLPIMDWMQRLAAVLGPEHLVTDVGSTKLEIAVLGAKLFNQPGRAAFLAGHPMAGKESGGAALAEAGLFQGSPWLFTPLNNRPQTTAEAEWRALVAAMGAEVRDLGPARHDEVCAWVSHLPQMLSTALAALLEDEFAGDDAGRAAVQAIGGRALRETTRLGASPYSMWRDVAMTNTEPIARTLLALEQRLAHLRENLRTPVLRDEFAQANRFRLKP